jgi:hypothetical protein
VTKLKEQQEKCRWLYIRKQLSQDIAVNLIAVTLDGKTKHYNMYIQNSGLMTRVTGLTVHDIKILHRGFTEAYLATRHK